MEQRRVSVFDTTLRDGEQAPGNSMTPQQKLELGLRLEALGVDVIEAGFPASSPSEAEATRMLSEKLTTARFASFCRAVRKDVEIAVTAGGTVNHEIQVLATASNLHLERKRQISRKEAVDELADTVRYAASTGVEVVSMALEDASRGDDELLRALVDAGLEAGVTCVVVADTSGCLTPEEFGELIAKFRSWAPPPIRLSTHCHNDFGLSLANTIAGLSAGADQAQTTLGGIGERAGNTAMEEVVALLGYKSERYGLFTDIDSVGMYDAYTSLREFIRLDQPRNKPIFGAYAFGTAAGMHQQGVLRDPSTYEFVEPARFGRERSLLIARHSGRSVLRHLLDQLGVRPGDGDIDELYRKHIIERDGGDCEDISVLRGRLVEELR
jgi:2-isopropylmalate synthase